jgi:hypothetical protein
MCRIEIPNRAIHREIQSRLEADPGAMVIGESQRGVRRSWAVICFAFSVGVAIGFLWKF